MKSRFLIVIIGIALGLVGRFIFFADGEVAEKTFKPGEIQPRDILQNYQPSATDGHDLDGLVEPIQLPPGQQLDAYVSRDDLLAMAKEHLEFQFDSQSHDDRASFHAHGDKVCASGCAVSNHPTEELPAWKYAKLIKRYGKEPLPEKGKTTLASTDAPSNETESLNNRESGGEKSGGEEEAPSALDELIYYGRQTRSHMLAEGTFGIDEDHVEFLKEQLKCNHAKIQIRVVDEHGEIRTWLPATRVPFDRRHVFDMEENNVQSLVTSGTVKRVGLDYLWVRL